MGMSTHIIGFKPPDEQWLKMKAVWDSCRAAGLPVPREVERFFNDEAPDEQGVIVALKSPAVREWANDFAAGFEVEIAKLDPTIKIIRFYSSW